VVRTLESLGLEPREEVRTPQGYSIDAVVSVDGDRVKVAVEVDGPSHFVGSSRVPSGSTALKRRQLRAAGVRLLAVPYWEWDALRNEAERREYLRRGLDEAGSSGGVGGMRGEAHDGAAAIDAGGGGVARVWREAATPKAGECEPAHVPLGWNEFQASVKGQGLSREEVHEAYHTQARHGGGG